MASSLQTLLSDNTEAVSESEIDQEVNVDRIGHSPKAASGCESESFIFGEALEKTSFIDGFLTHIDSFL